MDQKLEFQKKRNSNFFWVVPISFSNETRWIQIFCPDYLFFCWPHERTCFRQNDFQVLEFREGESDNSESKMFSIRFCRQIAQLSHWSNNASGLMMWACTLSFEQILVRSGFKTFFLSWFVATCYPVLCGNQTWASSCVFRSHFRGSFLKPILLLSWEFLSLICFF